jgi:hypothetical protein
LAGWQRRETNGDVSSLPVFKIQGCCRVSDRSLKRESRSFSQTVRSYPLLEAAAATRIVRQKLRLSETVPHADYVRVASSLHTAKPPQASMLNARNQFGIVHAY